MLRQQKMGVPQRRSGRLRSAGEQCARLSENTEVLGVGWGPHRDEEKLEVFYARTLDIFVCIKCNGAPITQLGGTLIICFSFNAMLVSQKLEGQCRLTCSVCNVCSG